MAYKVLILGASYGSLLGTKLLMAGHDATLVCRAETAALINEKGTDVRIKLRGEDEHRSILSGNQPGKLNAMAPSEVNVGDYDLVALAMQEPQYRFDDIRALMQDIAAAKIPCLSIMNMPPLAYLKRIPGIDADALRDSFTCPEVWDAFDPETVTLCSPDPQAFRLPDEGPNVLFVGLPTNFKAAAFSDPASNKILETLEADISAVTLDGNDVPVKLRVFQSLFVPLAKWSMLLTGNYRCVTEGGVRPIQEAVHGSKDQSAAIYAHVDAIARHLGADPGDQVPFEKYAKAAENLLKPSSVARAIDGGASKVERVDMVVKLIGDSIGMPSAEVDETVRIVNARLAANA
jgi:hypothetical protein